MKSYLLSVNLNVCAINVLFRNLSALLMCSRMFPPFSSIRFAVSGFMLSSFIHLDLSFVQGDRQRSICILLQADIQFQQCHLLKMLSFYHCIILVSSSKTRCPQMCIFMSGSSFQFHCFTCLFYADHLWFLLLEHCNRALNKGQ